MYLSDIVVLISTTVYDFATQKQRWRML